MSTSLVSFRRLSLLALSSGLCALGCGPGEGSANDSAEGIDTFTTGSASSSSGGETGGEASGSGSGTMDTSGSESADTGSGTAGDGDGDGDSTGTATTSATTGDGDGDGDSTGTATTGDGDGDGDTGGGLCTPGAVICNSSTATQTCAPGGDVWEPPVECGPGFTCATGECLTQCEFVELQPSSVGCIFHANKMQNFQEEPTSLVVGNVSDTDTASVQLFQGSGGVEMPVGGPVSVAPGAAHEFVLSGPTQPGDVSVLRTGGAYRVESDVPLVAYQHSPIAAVAHNDSSMLLPDHAQGRNFIVAAWPGNIGSDHSYFNVVGIEDATAVTWEPPQGSSAGTGVPAVAAGGMGMATVNANDMLQVISTSDISGTYISTDKRAWVVGAVPCVNIPSSVTFCDHIEEQMIPLEYWGNEYVGAHAPTRGSEDYWWRVYAGADNVTITTTPAQTGTPVTLNRGEFHQFTSTGSFMFTGDGPFMPVQYLEGQNGGAGTGDPASYQMVPTEQFLDRYVFITGTGYTFNYAQIIRPVGGAEVMVDGVMVTGYQTVGGFEVADWTISEGAHLAESTLPFGITQVGYTGVTSYAYPGGLRLRVINPQ